MLYYIKRGERMKKNNIIIINPVSINLMKAICNAMMSNIVNIIIFGNTNIIKQLCNKLNISISLFRIIQCNTENEILFKLQKYQECIPIHGIIIDELRDIKIKEKLKYNTICHMIDFGVFKKSIFVINFKSSN